MNEIQNAELKFTNFWDWFIHFRNPSEIWEEVPSYLIVELLCYLGGIVIFIHAFSRGGRWPFVIFAAIGHGLVVEYLSYMIPDIDNFWHAQSMIMLIGRRLPLHITLIYVIFYYHASWAVSKLKLKCPYSEFLAMGLITVLIDIPFDIIGIKYLHWTWHDTDPNIYDRSYWVPWTSYMFHASFAFSWSLAFHKGRKVFEKRDLEKWERGSIISELFSVLMASLLGMPGGCLLLVFAYHILHDILGIHTEVVALPAILLCIIVVWKFDRKSNRYEWPERFKTSTEKILLLHLFLHYAVMLMIPIIFKPENHISTGIHETIGNCDKRVPVQTLLRTLSKREFLCTSDYDEKYFDFHCLGKKVPEEGSRWYTICGTPFQNKAEYIWIETAIAAGAFLIFRTIHFDFDGRLLKVLHSQRGKKKVN